MSMYKGLYEKAKKVFSELPVESRRRTLEYINHQIQRQLSPQTIRETIGGLKCFFQQLEEGKQDNLSAITKQDIRGFMENLTEKKLCGSTINRNLSIVRCFFAYLVDEDYLDKNPVLRRYSVTQEKRLPRPMKETDIKVFLSALERPRDRIIFLLMLRCGLRVGEVTRLQVADIKWDNKNIIVKNGKGKVDRVVYFSKDAQEALRLWLETRKYKGEYCFISSYHKNRPISNRMIQVDMERLIKKSGLDGKGYGPHSLRHTFATLMLNAGTPLAILKELMGHKRLDQTLQYAKLSDQRIRDSYYSAMEKLEKEFTFEKEVDIGGLYGTV